MADFRMPSLGADMEAGTLIKWLKQAGETVKRSDIIAEVDTDKGAIEIEVFEDGVIEEIVAQPGEKVPVGRTLARIRTAGIAPAPAPAPPREAAQVTAATAAGAPAGEPGPPSPRRAGAPPPAHVAASPAARRRATELGLDLRSIAGTGPHGAITLADVEGTAAAAAAPAPAPARQQAMRRAIASAMAKSKREIPHAYVTTTIDMFRAMAWLRAENERRSVGDRLLPAVLLLKAVATAVPDVPEVNGYWLEDRLQPTSTVHLGTAIALRGGGLISPAIHDVGQRDLGALMRGLADLVARARSGALRGSELTDATITVTNLGDQGVDGVLPIIYPPQVAIVGFGRIVERPWVVDGRIEPRPVLNASLSFDHRAVDGHRAGLFLASVDRRLQAPGVL
ncbi:MAG: 2-oxo acid dehydrogenase subunit E2 [Acidobacteria bacterium]|nr:2-oxo acid dehydrogenase subunit E2 [Acidobacteriota bacterium]